MAIVPLSLLELTRHTAAAIIAELEKDGEKRKILPRISAAFKNPLKVP
jgi:hypothetical protein